MLKLNDPIDKLYGVGNVKKEAYAKMGIHTVEDLLLHFPRAYEYRGDIKKLSEADPNTKCSFVLTVSTPPRIARIRRGMELLKFRAFDESGSCDITYFNQNYLKDKITLGSEYRFWGKVECTGVGKYSMASPVCEAYIEGLPLPDFYPVYRLSEGLSQKNIASHIDLVLSVCQSELSDPIPVEIRQRRELCSLTFAYRAIHAPKDYSSLAIAKKRLIYQEFFTFSLGMNISRVTKEESFAYPCEYRDVSEFTDSLPYELTRAQSRAINEILTDMSKDTAMTRILVGDVGCGKTVCAAAAIFAAVKSGRQAALMAPTEILAEQHYRDLSSMFSKFGIRTALLTGSTTDAQKRKIYASLEAENKEERTDLVVGTHALLSDKVKLICSGLIITDEQHRFGVGQRAMLSERGKHSHMLVMSATPIPRSLALILYGDLKLSLIDEMPKGRQRVDTYCVDESYRQRINAFISKTVNEGGQVYVVCPAVNESEDDDFVGLSMSDIGEDDEGVGDRVRKSIKLKAATAFASELQELFPNIPVGCIHGKLKASEKDSIMQGFVSGEIKILVSTTVIEVGVNVPNASLMVIENAERFGLSQLHQLRGRVGRGKRKSYCVLMAGGEGEISEKARKRLDIMHTVYDGYVIAEEDLKQRGPGDFLASHDDMGSIRQSGGMKFRLAEFCDDSGILKSAAEDAEQILNDDRELSSYPELRAEIEKMFRIELNVIN